MDSSTDDDPLLSGAIEMLDRSVSADHIGRTKCDRPRPRPPASLIQLPVELVLAIAEYLPPESRILLSLTCRNLKTILERKDDALTVSHLLSRPRLDFFTMISRDLYGYWACELCFRLHKICENDVRGCERRRGRTTCYGGEHSRRAAAWTVYYTPRQSGHRHYHVQLALRYTRLIHQGVVDNHARCADRPPRPWHWRPHSAHYLQRLMKPHVAYSLIDQPCQPYYMRLHSQPKIIMDPSSGRLRFLQRSMASITSTRPYTARCELGRSILCICPHLYVRRPCAPSEWRQCRNHPIEVVMLESHFVLVEVIHRPTSGITNALHYRDNGTQYGSCRKCLTDYAFRSVSTIEIEIHLWHDFGTERSPANAESLLHPLDALDLCDGLQTPYAAMLNLTNNPNTPSTYHEPGSIRSTYEKGGAVCAWEMLDPEPSLWTRLSGWLWNMLAACHYV